MSAAPLDNSSDYGIITITVPIESQSWHNANPTPRPTPCASTAACTRTRRRSTDELFASSEFFDPRDLVQVKYEMLRRVRMRRTGESAQQRERASASRDPSYYQAQEAFEEGGLPALLPKKARAAPRAQAVRRGGRGFCAQERAEDPALTSAGAGADWSRERFGLSVHPRSIERALARQEKKRRHERSAARCSSCPTHRGALRGAAAPACSKRRAWAAPPRPGRVPAPGHGGLDGRLVDVPAPRSQPRARANAARAPRVPCRRTSAEVVDRPRQP